MNCFYCKGDFAQTKSAYVVEISNSIIVIKGVPTNICLKCGYKSYIDIVSARIEAIVGRMSNMLPEIAIVHYSSVDSVA